MRDFKGEINLLKSKKEVYDDLKALLSRYEAELDYYKAFTKDQTNASTNQDIERSENKIGLIVGVIEYAEQMF